MWAAIRSDLEEFVTTVKDESTEVGKKVGVPPTTRSSGPATNQHTNDYSNNDDDDEHATPIFMEDGDVIYENENAIVAAQEAERRMMEPETFVVPLDATQQAQLIEFQQAFDIDAKTDEISALLEAYPESLKLQFETLVPTQVQYKDFWERYYFRCDQERILHEFQQEEEEARKARAEAIAKGVNSVKNLFGGAVKAVSSTLEQYDQKQEDHSTTMSYMGESMTAGQAMGGLRLFGGERPPFVMNTAVGEEQDEEEEEEELGWDDEESFGEDEEDAADDDTEEQVEFSGGKDDDVTTLKQQLSLALEEREQLHQTVELQTKEIASLRVSGDEKPAPTHNKGEEVETLKLQLFEKDSELAALRASLDDTEDADREAAIKKDAAKVASLEREVERLMELVATSVRQKKALEEDLQMLKRNSDDLQGKVEEAEDGRLEMERQITSLKEMLGRSQDETAAALASLESCKRDAASRGLESQEEATLTSRRIVVLEAELEETKGNLDLSSRRADHLEKRLETVQMEMAEKEAAFEARLTEEIAKARAERSSDASRGSMSTGVNVAQEELEHTSPLSPTVTHIDAGSDDADEDDWGDDWGDEDD